MGFLVNLILAVTVPVLVVVYIGRRDQKAKLVPVYANGSKKKPKSN